MIAGSRQRREALRAAVAILKVAIGFYAAACVGGLTLFALQPELFGIARGISIYLFSIAAMTVFSIVSWAQAYLLVGAVGLLCDLHDMWMRVGRKPKSCQQSRTP